MLRARALLFYVEVCILLLGLIACSVRQLFCEAGHMNLV